MAQSEQVSIPNTDPSLESTTVMPIGTMTEKDWQRLELEMMIETLTYNRG